MRKPTDREWTSIALLSIIVPMSLLVSFRLTGILPEPPTPQTTTVETVTWNMSRPVKYIIVDEKVNNSYGEDFISVNFSVQILHYDENSVTWIGFDVVWLRLSLNVSAAKGFAYSAIVKFSKVDDHSALDVDEDVHDHFKLVNLELLSIKDWDFTMGRDAYVNTITMDQPQHVYLQFDVRWMFADPNNVNHRVSIVSEYTYFDGTMYRKVIIPIRLEVLVD